MITHVWELVTGRGHERTSGILEIILFLYLDVEYIACVHCIEIHEAIYTYDLCTLCMIHSNKKYAYREREHMHERVHC